jgi:leucyl aminopeptidase
LRFTASARSLSSRRPEALVVCLFEGARQASTLPDGKLRQALEGLIRSEGFQGKRGGTLVFHSAGRFPARRVILAGLGRKGRYDLEAIRQGAAAAAARAAASTARTVTFALPPELPGGGESVADRVRATAEGFLLGTYRLRKYLTGENRREASSLRSGEIVVPAAHLRQAQRSARLASAACRVTNLARDLVNEPAASLTPVKMAEYARALAGGAGLECRIHDEKDLEKLGMGAFLGVAGGSHQPPRMIHLVYRPKGKPARKVALVGKGLTFDSGGLSLKTSTGMETMKLDKSGAATVLATMLGLGETRPEVEVHGLLGMAENMPGGSAMKPGDVVRTCGGKTVEVLNTDAEGRLVLADVLGYARTLGVDEIIDLATLTGAVMIALGPLATGLFTDDDDLARGLLEASGRCGEKTWHLPMYDEYKDQLQSQIADLKNTAGRYGGAITAAMFLREFAGRETRWAHLDIAGPAFLETSRHPYLRKGGTGAGVRTLLTYLSSISGRT